jgi:hypothetical protein
VTEHRASYSYGRRRFVAICLEEKGEIKNLVIYFTKIALIDHPAARGAACRKDDENYDHP